MMVVLLFVLTGCGSENVTNNTSKNNTTNSTAKTNTVKEEEKVEVDYAQAAEKQFA